MLFDCVSAGMTRSGSVYPIEISNEILQKAVINTVDYLVKHIEVADRKTENSSEIPNNSTISKMEQVDKDINVRSKDESQTDCAEALTLLWINNMVTDEEFYRIDARLKCISCKW